MSQRELAQGCISPAHLSRVESGEREPTVAVLRRLSGRLGVSAEFLEFGSEVYDIVRARRAVAAALGRARDGGKTNARNLERAAAALRVEVGSGLTVC